MWHFWPLKLDMSSFNSVSPLESKFKNRHIMRHLGKAEDPLCTEQKKRFWFWPILCNVWPLAEKQIQCHLKDLTTKWFLDAYCLFIHALHRVCLSKSRDVGIYRRVSIYIVQLTQSQQKNTNVQGVSIFFYLVFGHFCLLLHLIELQTDHWSEIQNVAYQTKPQYLYFNMQKTRSVYV